MLDLQKVKLELSRLKKEFPSLKFTAQDFQYNSLNYEKDDLSNLNIINCTHPIDGNICIFSIKAQGERGNFDYFVQTVSEFVPTPEDKRGNYFYGGSDEESF